MTATVKSALKPQPGPTARRGVAASSGLPAAERDSQFASTLSSGIDLLLCYRAGESVLGNGDFVQRTGLSKDRKTHV